MLTKVFKLCKITIDRVRRMVIMNIEKYKENNRRKKIIITFMFFVIAIFGGVIITKHLLTFKQTKTLISSVAV